MKPLCFNINSLIFGLRKVCFPTATNVDVWWSWLSGLLDAVGRSLLVSDWHLLSTRVLVLNTTSGHLTSVVVWRKVGVDTAHRVTDSQLQPGARPDPSAPWYEDAQTSPALRSPKFMSSPALVAYRGWWTFPYYSCYNKLWMMSYSVVIPPSPKHG